ncbi:hypothetical protein TNCV_3389811 [Trichonephila clavipes]|nr:hypothetical protein TNCV_3389811 [Trichonephila clavipes]
MLVGLLSRWCFLIGGCGRRQWAGRTVGFGGLRKSSPKVRASRREARLLLVVRSRGKIRLFTVRERVLLNGENLDQLRDSYERVLKCVKNKLLTYTLSEYVVAEVDRLPEIDSLYYDVDSPHGLRTVRFSM